MVYVLNSDNKPLMPTSRYSKVRRLLKENRATVVNREPFTIKLLYQTEKIIQPITLGIDSGSKFIGLSAVTPQKEVFAAEYQLRDDIVKLLSDKRQYRKTRRNRNTRYRKAKFLNRVKSKRKGWLAPSIEHKIQSHINIINKIYKILPISNICVEVASFDIHKILNPDVEGIDYQNGPQKDTWNVREYVLFRDNHTCQNPKCNHKDPILNTHHIKSRKIGGNSPKNLITLCNTCHENYHKGLLDINFKTPKSLKDSAFMGIMRWSLYDKLQELYSNVSMTYGYLTKFTRIRLGLDKTHYNDAFSIAANSLNSFNIEKLQNYYLYKKVRCQNRQIHKAKILKGNRRKLNQAPYLVKGFRLFDKVLYQDKPYYIFGRRTSGFFDIRTLCGEKVNKGSISYKKLTLIEKRKFLLCSQINSLLLLSSHE